MNSGTSEFSSCFSCGSRMNSHQSVEFSAEEDVVAEAPVVGDTCLAGPPTTRTTTTTTTTTTTAGTSVGVNGGPIRSVSGRHGKRVSRFVFTLNNYTTAEHTAVKSLVCKWLIVAQEVGENGTPHLQGACVLHAQKAYSTLHMLPGFARCHFEVMNGTPQHSRVYCTKQDPFYFESGECPCNPGKRNDLVDVIVQIRSGSNFFELAQSDSAACAMVRYSKGLTFLRTLYASKRDIGHPPLVLWFSGPTGTGKTRKAVELGLNAPISRDIFPWMSSGSLRWFDGYDGQPVAIFDDLRTKHVEFSMLLRLLDRYPLQVEIKGGYTNWAPHIIFITAPNGPEEMWSLRTQEQLDQLTRRVTRHFEFPLSEESEVQLTELVTSRLALSTPDSKTTTGTGPSSDQLERGDSGVNTGNVGSSDQLQHDERDVGGSGFSGGIGFGGVDGGNGSPHGECGGTISSGDEDSTLTPDSPTSIRTLRNRGDLL